MRGPAFPRRVRVGRVVFRDPLCTCALLYILLFSPVSSVFCSDARFI